MSGLEEYHCIAVARELTYAAGVPLRDRYGFAARDKDVAFVLDVLRRQPDDEAAGMEIGGANGTGDLELADGYDTPIDEEYEQRIIAALRPLLEQRRDTAVRRTK